MKIIPDEITGSQMTTAYSEAGIFSFGTALAPKEIAIALEMVELRGIGIALYHCRGGRPKDGLWVARSMVPGSKAFKAKTSAKAVCAILLDHVSRLKIKKKSRSNA